MKLSPSVTVFGVIVVLTIVAAAFRVATGPDRARQRMETAKTTCLSLGGEWVKVGRNNECRVADGAKKP